MRSIQYFRHLMTITNLPNQRKHIRRWGKSLQSYLLNNGIPWITYDAVDFIENRFPKNAKVFEYGSGDLHSFGCGTIAYVFLSSMTRPG